MLRFIRTTWRMMYFWKLLMVGAVLLFSLVILNIKPGDFDLEFNDAIKAPFFALASASTLFLGMIPKNAKDYNDVFADVSIRLTGAFTACLAGWHWLLGEIEGDSTPYIIALIPVFVFIGAVVLTPFLIHVISSLLRPDPPSVDE